ncbi:hypothetical protein HCN44_010913 [Aphidius gifuensis]|uniref:Wolframin n=1 Tax=Aphidius gifuensis TaxID=684658 RepID=A0A834Y346_APHGI|nr:wolframin [Aphidius gifuensis]KAF7998505.1 hypothetical protein HCN44_010913 [Aphidius gifuensis]
MAGIVPLPGKTIRKQWFMHDEPRGSFRGLRSQLPEDNHPESQLILAKRFLEETNEHDVDKEENAKIGVHWLIKASEQGNFEATEILRKCLETGNGITEHNYYDVKCCLSMSQDEKLARRAARYLFTNLSKGEDFVTIDQLQKQMMIARQRSRSSSEDSLDDSDKSDKSDDSKEEKVINNEPQKSLEYGIGISDKHHHHHRGEKITEAALVSAASSYARGLLPTVSKSLCMIDPAQLELNNIPFLQRPFVHPVASLKSLYEWIIKKIGGRDGNFLKLFFTSNIQTLLLLILYPLFGTESLVLFLPMLAYYISFIIMVVATFQMLHSQRELNNFQNWSGLFISYSGTLNPEEAEYQFCRNNLKPYGHFFLALLVNLMIYPIIAHQWTPQSEFTLIAFILTSITLVNFSWQDSRFPDIWVLFSFGVHVLAKYPYETDIVVGQTWRFLDIRVPTFASYFVGNGIEFCLNFRAVFYLLIPAVFMKIGSREGWKGTYKTLIPHCVTLSWWQIAILSSQGATWYGLIRGALALVGLVLFLPIAGLASILLPIVASVKYLSDSQVAVKIIVTTILGGLPFVASWLLRKTRISQFNWIVTGLQVILGLIAVIFLSWPISQDFRSDDSVDIMSQNDVPTLTWEQYQNHCHQPAWEELSNKAQVQLQCAQLEGILVSWEGYVTNIQIKAIDNTIENFIRKLPTSLESKMSCIFGETVNQDYCKKSNPVLGTYCNIIGTTNQQKERCHLFNWNRYEFEISVKMKNGIWGNKAEIVLIGDDSFKNFSLNIYPGDQIRFSGILTNYKLENESLLGGSRPHVYLEDIGCLVCHTIDLKSYKRQPRFKLTFNLFWSTLVLGFKTILNFLLNPLVVFK